MAFLLRGGNHEGHERCEAHERLSPLRGSSAVATVQVSDRATNLTTRPFTVVRDAISPTLSLNATVQGGDVHVTWSATDPDSGVDASTCLLEVREDEGAWQTFSTQCGGDDTHDGQPGHTYTFRLTAADNVSNTASTEAQASVPRITKHYYANGQRLATRVDGALYYVHQDHVGSTVAVSDAAGGEVGRVQYDPYGEVLTSTLPADLTDRLFTGQRFDSSSGLYYYNARYYDPHLGRFIQPDTLVPDPLNPQAWNRFSYVYNNPVSYVDPSGHQVVPLLIGFTVAAIIWLAYPRIAEAPAPGEVLTPPDYDPGYGEKAFLDTAPGTGDISDAWAVVTGRRLYTGDPQSRLGAFIFTILPFAAGGVITSLRRADDAAPRRQLPGGNTN
jgi:RHS repeat-associated protein